MFFTLPVVRAHSRFDRRFPPPTQAYSGHRAGLFVLRDHSIRSPRDWLVAYDRYMLYRKTAGPIRPFNEDDTRYMFVFFCAGGPQPLIGREWWVPKSAPYGVCGDCTARVFVRRDKDGVHLEFDRGEHSAAEGCE